MNSPQLSGVFRVIKKPSEWIKILGRAGWTVIMDSCITPKKEKLKPTVLKDPLGSGIWMLTDAIKLHISRNPGIEKNYIP